MNQTQLVYILSSFALGGLTLWGMGKLHEMEGLAGARQAPTNIMRALRCSLFVCGVTLALQFALPIAGTGVDLLRNIRDLGWAGGLAYFILGVVDLCRPRGLIVRPRANGAEDLATFQRDADRPHLPMHREVS